jgi:SAM-dependent methyltransferase
MTCGHVYLGPLLDDAEEQAFYRRDYPAFLVERGDFKSLSPQDHFSKNAEEAARRWEIARHLFSPEATVLEIGSATGFFLYLVKQHAREVLGVEPYTAYRDYANSKGVPTVAALDGVGERRFDIVLVYYVLEHVKDPRAFLQALLPLLRDTTSRIVIEVPNVNEALVSLYKCPAYNGFIWQRAHCSYFSVDVLRKLYESMNATAEFVPVQRYDFSNHMYWLIAGKPGGMGKYSRIFSERLNNEYKENLKASWLCDTILSIVHPGRAS